MLGMLTIFTYMDGLNVCPQTPGMSGERDYTYIPILKDRIGPLNPISKNGVWILRDGKLYRTKIFPRTLFLQEKRSPAGKLPSSQRIDGILYLEDHPNEYLGSPPIIIYNLGSPPIYKLFLRPWKEGKQYST